jgi:hypothetical protein
MNKLLVLLLLTTNVYAKCVVQQKTIKQGNMIEQQMIETCDDNQKFNVGEIGFSGRLELFKTHPNFPKLFTHNGTICRWLLDNELKDNGVIGYQGIICKVKDNWTVVDKF